jgi:2-polyprenyl-6-methoxyphenol hydroxylase-like FAD-dependent oxidoreductase
MTVSSHSRHAEIAGAGIGGLAAACSLASRGWSVRVHERNTELRELGAGIAIWENGVNALRELGAAAEATRGCDRIDHWELRDERNRLLQSEWLLHEAQESYAVLRQQLHNALASRAAELGAEICLQSRVASATREGDLILEDGRRLKADLVVGADGVHSKVRDSVGLKRRVNDLGDGCGRHLVDRKPGDPANVIIEQWDGGRRIGVVPCTSGQIYIYLCCPATDDRGILQEHDRSTWIASFPEQAEFIERIPDGGTWLSFSDAVVTAWSAGKVALIGDAAHAMSPNLGQAACVGMANAVALGQALDAYPDTSQALRTWEDSERAVTEATQRYSRFYGWIGTHWPRPLLDLRSALVWGLANSKQMQSRINVAARHVPQIGGTGSSPVTTAG